MSATQPASQDTVEISIEGISCSACANSVTRALSRVPGVANVTVDLDAGRARVAGSASPENLVAAIAKAGYGARLT